MTCMTLHAEKRLGDLKHGFVRGSVRAVTVSALFSDIGMFIDERPLVLHMTSCAQVFGRHTLEVATVR